MDKLLWEEAGFPIPREVFNKNHAALLAKEQWIIDGIGPSESIRTRFIAADMIVFIDQPLWRHIYWMTKREVRKIIQILSGHAEG